MALEWLWQMLETVQQLLTGRERQRVPVPARVRQVSDPSQRIR